MVNSNLGFVWIASGHGNLLLTIMKENEKQTGNVRARVEWGHIISGVAVWLNVLSVNSVCYLTATYSFRKHHLKVFTLSLLV